MFACQQGALARPVRLAAAIRGARHCTRPARAISPHNAAEPLLTSMAGTPEEGRNSEWRDSARSRRPRRRAAVELESHRSDTPSERWSHAYKDQIPAGGAILVVAGFTTAEVALPAQGASKIQRGAEIAPVPLNMRGLNPALVAREATSSTRRAGATIVTPFRRMRPVGIHSPVNQKRSTRRVTSPAARPSDRSYRGTSPPREAFRPAGHWTSSCR